MKTYQEELDEMIDAVIKLVWNHTVFAALFEKEYAAQEARQQHPELFLTLHDSLVCSFCVMADFLFEDKKEKAVSLCNLIKKIEAAKPQIANNLNSKIRAQSGTIEKIGTLRNQAFGHRWRAKPLPDVFAEASVTLSMMKEIAGLAQSIVTELAGDAGGGRLENLQRQWLSHTTLQCVANDAAQVVRAFAEPVAANNL